MAKLAPGIEFTGPLGSFSAYKRFDVEGTLLRQKGGPSGEQIQTLDTCASVRKNNSEFGGSSKAASDVYKVLKPLNILFDFQVYQNIVKQLKALQKTDSRSAWGQRNINLSMAPGLLNGFQLNKRNPLESIVRSPFGCSISKENLTATVETPALHPGMNFFPLGNFPVYRWMFSFGLIPDMVFNEVKGFVPTEDEQQIFSCVMESGWFHVAEQAAPVTMNLVIPFKSKEPSYSVMLAAGISFGMIQSGGEIQAVKSFGAGKVIGME